MVRIGMPVPQIKAKAAKRDAGLDVIVVVDILVIVNVDKIMPGCLTEDENHAQDQQDANEWHSCATP